MKGLDKRAYRILRGLSERRDVPENDRALAADMILHYDREDWHFFTERQRKLSRDLFKRYDPNRPNPDEKYFKALRELTEIVPEDTGDRNIIDDFLSRWDTGKFGSGMSPRQRDLVRSLCRKYKKHNTQKEFCIQLKIKLKQGTVREGSENFCADVINFFEKRHYWTGIQQEHVEKILVDNADPEDNPINAL